MEYPTSDAFLAMALALIAPLGLRDNTKANRQSERSAEEKANEQRATDDGLTGI